MVDSCKDQGGSIRSEVLPSLTPSAGCLPPNAPLRRLHLDVLFSRLSELFQSEVALARVDRRRRSDAGALALRSRGDGLHGVEVLRRRAAFLQPPARAPAQRLHHAFAPAVGAFRDGFDLIIIPQQLWRKIRFTHQKEGHHNTSGSCLRPTLEMMLS